MPSVSVSPFGPKPTFTLSSGLPAVGYKLFFYLAGSVGTKQDTYSSSTGTVANTNPVVLDVNGTPPDELWFVTGLAYKVVYAPAADTDPPTSAIWTIDNLRGIGDATITPSEWVASSLVPTYISATSFSLVGDQTATFQVGRRLKSTNTSGTVYSTIATSVFSTVTTVTVVNDASALDSGLVAVSYGIISVDHTSDPFQGTASTGDVNGPASAVDGHLVQFNGTTGKVIKDGIALDTDGTLAANSDTRVATQKAVKTFVTASSSTGDVVGPASSTDGHFATYNGATGKLLKDTLALDTDTTLAADSDTRVASQKAVKAYVTASAGGSPTSITGTTGATGGNAIATGGTSTTSANAGGEARLIGGTPGATGVGGIARITGGAGGATSGAGGAVTIASGTPVAGNGGDVSITASSGVGSSKGPGSITLTAGASTSGGGQGGAITLRSGGADASSGVGGHITLTTQATAGNCGDVILTGGNAAGVNCQGGGITLSAGVSTNATAGRDIAVTAGTGGSTSGAGGVLTLKGGPGGGPGTGGAATLQGGNAGATGDGGAASVIGGTAAGGAGGAVNITGSAGVGTNKAGGNVVIRPGAATGTGNPGNIQLDGGRGAALATTAIGGFVTIPTCAGTPTATPVNVPTGSVAMVFDTTGSKLWIFTAAAWKGVVVA